MFRTIPRHEEDGIGLPYPVVLIDSAEEELDASGAVVGLSVPDLEGLAVSVAVARALHPWQLAGSEVRFLRHVLDLSGRQMAQALGMDHATLSRWENGRQELGGWADKQVRYVVLLMLHDRAPGMRADAKDAVRLRIVPRPPGAWPVFEMRRVHGAESVEGWDRMRVAA